MRGETITRITDQEAFIIKLNDAKKELEASKKFKNYFDPDNGVEAAIKHIDQILNTIYQT
jgi:hypothetical protein